MFYSSFVRNLLSQPPVWLLKELPSMAGGCRAMFRLAEMPSLSSIALETCLDRQGYNPKGSVWLLQGKEAEALWRGGCRDGLLGSTVWEVQSWVAAGPPLPRGASSLLRLS